MGGFTLKGKKYTFISLNHPSGITCNCLGYRSDISDHIESYLLNKSREISEFALRPEGQGFIGNRKLEIEDLPDKEFKEEMRKSHWNIMGYSEYIVVDNLTSNEL